MFIQLDHGSFKTEHEALSKQMCGLPSSWIAVQQGRTRTRTKPTHIHIHPHTQRHSYEESAEAFFSPSIATSCATLKPQALQEHKVGFNAEARNVPCTSKAQRVFSPDPPLDRKSQVQKSLRIPGCE